MDFGQWSRACLDHSARGVYNASMTDPPTRPLRTGWTTGACATAATKAAFTALVTGAFPDPVEIALPKGHRPAFALARHALAPTWASAAVIKDAGDDPDVTHGALIASKVWPGPPNSDVTFRAGPGVGTVTRAGLPLPPGEPAINPVPRQLIRDAVHEVAAATGASTDLVVEIAIPDGEEMARQTWNPRLGIVGGLSVLGTTGVVVPYSCSAWIHSIHRGIDVARAAGLQHVAAATGSTSERLLLSHYDLPEIALLDMGDFAGGLLKYMRRHPLPKLTIAGGFAKITKLGQGFLDLHSKRSQVDKAWLCDRLAEAGAPNDLIEAARQANTASEILTRAEGAGLPLGDLVAAEACAKALDVLDGCGTEVEVLVTNRAGELVGRADG
jgi:cobalt-precorrin-5B (C1)-methyltransferase